MSRAIPPLPQYAFMAWCSAEKKKHRNNFTFTFIPNLFIEIQFYSLHLITLNHSDSAYGLGSRKTGDRSFEYLCVCPCCSVLCYAVRWAHPPCKEL